MTKQKVVRQEFRDEVRYLVDRLLKDLTGDGSEAETQKRVVDAVAGALEPLTALHEEYVRREREARRAGRYVVTLEVGRLKETRIKETINEVFSLMAAYDLYPQKAITEGLNEHGTVRLGEWTVMDKQWERK